MKIKEEFLKKKIKIVIEQKSRFIFYLRRQKKKESNILQ